MIKRILVGLGGTPFTTVSTHCATKLAKRHQAQTTGVTVVDMTKLGKLGPVPAGAGHYARRMRARRTQVTREGIEAAVEAFKNSCNDQNVVCRRIEYEQQDPFTAMIAEARYNDLTIFGLRSMFDYGFVSDPNKAIIKLVTQGVRPILAVADTYRPVKKVLIAYSGSMESAKAIRHFLHLKPWPDVKLHIVHFEEGAGSEPFLLDHAADFCKAHGFDVRTDLVKGQARTNLMPFAQGIDADLIVMGNSVHKTLVKQLLGDTVLETIKSADRPLFLSQ
ncbi:putative universal stress protein [Desulfosarcina variabilis str. Montpellier]|uniref:universal stress protein n=1 Tax=Desulfosarcina variabilis TaxID=2300 RepID=UPI003AFB3D72